jgi:hypothetical protein
MMKGDSVYKTLLVLSFSLAFLVSGCAQQNPQALLGGNDSGGVEGGSSDTVGSGAAMDSSGTVVPGDDGSIVGGIDSSGAVSAAGTQSSEPGTGDGSGYDGSLPGSGETGGSETGSGSPVQWIEYTDPNLGYSLSYPTIYTILPETQALSDLSPIMVGRLRMLEPEIAKSEFADMEPPKFSIEIFSNEQALPLDGWLTTTGLDGDLEKFQVDGVECQKLTLKIQLAPNQFIICMHDDKIFKFTPMGLYSDEILKSFKFLVNK